ncbi:MmcQ/YjbR family DNA-binding protein [Devosia sp.]|uniref:MmcQ/YjbR family DNA-binding protein n=1 Tax=Devosia sp. TaxID=1871048 RepID=UPI0032651C69
MVTRAEFETITARLTAVTFVEQWGSLVAKVGGKVFTLRGFGPDGSVVFKIPEASFDMLTIDDGIEQAPYFARRHWVMVAPAAMPTADLALYIAASHGLVARKLTKKLQGELGLLTPQ